VANEADLQYTEDSRSLEISERKERISESKRRYTYEERKLTTPNADGKHPRNYLPELEIESYKDLDIMPYPVTDQITITLVGDPIADISPNRAPGSGSYYGYRGNSQKNMMMKWQRLLKEWKEISRDTWIAYGKPKFVEPIQICFHIARARIVDPDNALATYKRIIDGMCDKKLLGEVGLVPDDSAKWIRYAPVQFSTGHMHRINPYTLIVICPTRIADEVIRTHLNRQKEIQDAIKGDSQ
jgi:hypothetical protein